MLQMSTERDPHLPPHLPDDWMRSLTWTDFVSDGAGKVERGCHAENWARAVVMQDIVERLEAEGATVVRKKGVIVAVFDED